jgi:hypothetical protein
MIQSRWDWGIGQPAKRKSIISIARKTAKNQKYHFLHLFAVAKNQAARAL